MLSRRRAADHLPSTTSNMKFFVGSAIFLSVTTVVAVVTVTALVPGNTSIVTTIVGITTPITMALLAAGLHGLSVTIDGKMSQLLEATAQKERLGGIIEGLKENPKVNLGPKE